MRMIFFSGIIAGLLSMIGLFLTDRTIKQFRQGRKKYDEAKQAVNHGVRPADWSAYTPAGSVYRYRSSMYQRNISHPFLFQESGRRLMHRFLLGSGLICLGSLMFIILFIYIYAHCQATGSFHIFLYMMCFTGLMCGILGGWISFRSSVRMLIALILEYRMRIC